MQLLICLLSLTLTSTSHSGSLGRPVLEQRLLFPRFQGNSSSLPLVSEGENCLSLYAFYRGKCTKDRSACPDRNCASALDAFKCCLKQGQASPWELQQSGVTVANVTRWEALGFTSLWINIRRALIARAEACQKRGYEPISPCAIPDFPPVHVDPSSSQRLYQTEMQRELASALAEVQTQELQIRRDIDDFGLSDQIQTLSELSRREAALRSQLSP